LYCGGGGIDEGLRQAGIKVKLAIDIDADFCETIRMNHGTETICGGVDEYIGSLPQVDIIVGGPPCPEFSRANSERTFDVREVVNFMHIVENIKPEYYLMENVQDVIHVFSKWNNFLLDAADYGVPQNRVRRFFTNLSRPEPSHTKDGGYTLLNKPVKKWVSVKEALGFDDAPRFISPTGYKQRNKKILTRSINEPIETITIADTYRITDRPVHSIKYKQYKQDYIVERKITLEELALLQGFPSSYKFAGGKDKTHIQIGNAVPPPVIKAIFSQVN